MNQAIPLQTLLQKMCDAWDNEKDTHALNTYFELLKEMLKDAPPPSIKPQRPYVPPRPRNEKVPVRMSPGDPDDLTGVELG